MFLEVNFTWLSLQSIFENYSSNSPAAESPFSYWNYFLESLLVVVAVNEGTADNPAE